MKFIKLAYKFIFKTKHRGLVIKTILLSAHACFRIKFYPGSKVHRFLGKNGGITPYEKLTQHDDMRKVYFVSDKLARVIRHVPWDSKCLVQAMVAQRLLRDYGLTSTLYLGVGRNRDTGEMIAHAWVRCGTYAVCGGDGKGYGVVATFLM